MDDKTPLAAQTDAVNRETADIDLRSIRESRGIALKDIFAATRITVVNLEAIETGQYHLLPEPVYSRTFIRSYARFLDIDSAPLLRKYEHYLNSLKPRADLPGEAQRQELPQKGKRRRLIIGALSIIFLMGLITAIILLETSYWREPSPSAPAGPSRTEAVMKIEPPQTALPAPTPESQAPPAANQQAALPPAGAVATPAVPGPMSASTTPALHLKIEARERTWIRLTVDQERPVQLTLTAGEKMERTAKEAFLIVIGNAGGVQMWFQGQPLPSLGKRGEVKHLKLP